MADWVVTCPCSLLPFKSTNSYSNMSWINHIYIVCSISNCKSCCLIFIIPLFDFLNKFLTKTPFWFFCQRKKWLEPGFRKIIFTSTIFDEYFWVFPKKVFDMFIWNDQSIFWNWLKYGELFLKVMVKINFVL